MREQFSRTALVIGEEGVEKLMASSVILFGVGGVGSFAAEGLARAGIGRIMLVDRDVVDITNINRQLPALHSTLGCSKVQVMKDRIEDINPECKVDVSECFFMPETSEKFDFREYDYVIDAIDTVTGKIAIIEKAFRQNVPVISSMGTGNKTDPRMFRIDLIENTRVCPLAKVMRKELKKKGIQGVKVLYSEEQAVKHEGGRVTGSISFVPSVAGMIIAGEVIRDIVGY